MGRAKDIMSFDDIVFENRNQEYGAYQLRRQYNSLLMKAIIATVIMVSASVVIPFIKIKDKSFNYSPGSGRNYSVVQMENISPPPDDIFIPPEVPPPPPAAQNVVKYVSQLIVDSVTPKEATLPTIEEARGTVDTENQPVTLAEGSGGDELFGESSGDAPYDFFILEVPPKFRGGDLDKFREWLWRRVVYPPEAQSKGIQGRVYLTFVVERDGTVTNVNIVKGVDKLLDEEAKKAVEASPPWSPGLQRGRPVRVRFSIYLNFAL